MTTPYDPLFKIASAAAQRTVRESFRRSQFGQLIREVDKAQRDAVNGPRRMGRVLKSYRSLGPAQAVKELTGLPVGNLAREVARYSKRGGIAKRLLTEFLGQLGPAGKLIQAIAGGFGGGGGSIESDLGFAAALLRAYGYHVLPPQRAATPDDWNEGVRHVSDFLENLGYTVIPPDEEGPFVGRAEPEERPKPQPMTNKQVVDIPMANGRVRQFPARHPIVTGDMVPVRSSNVHSIGYDADSVYLYVRFLQPSPILSANKADADRKGPGPLYRYRDVEPEQFLAMLAAPSKGEWLWDNIRVRGTASGHRKDYELVGVMHDYVPRKSTLMADGKEWFLQRKIRTTGGRWLTSSRRSEPVPASFYQQYGRPPATGQPPGPNTGRPR